MGLKPESTGKSYNKVEKKWNDCPDDTGGFSKMNQTEKNDIEGASGTQLVTSLNIFSTWILNESETVLFFQKKLCWNTRLMSKTIGTFCVMLERKQYFASCKDTKVLEV